MLRGLKQTQYSFYFCLIFLIPDDSKMLRGLKLDEARRGVGDRKSIPDDSKMLRGLKLYSFCAFLIFFFLIPDDSKMLRGLKLF